MMFKDRSDADYLTRISRHVEVLDHALRNVPADRVRMHVCWGNYEGPHHHDVEMRVILPVLLKAKPAGLLFETANPRHNHELEAFVEHRALIGDDKILIPGVIDSTTNFIEHPRVVANRLRGFVDLVGVERVLGGTDCGFSTFAGFGAVDPDIVYAKLATLAEGAALLR
jgi:5-methyltetrahydropteroyltriglutamate--homocysteine methyltransferase